MNIWINPSRHRTGSPRKTSLLLTCVVWMAISSFGMAQTKPESRDWPQFLGPQRNGISTETGLIDSWPDNGPIELWRVPGGVGMSGLAISRGLLLTLVQNDGEQRLVSFNALTGEKGWERTLAPEYKNGM